ncbi:aromatic compound dioxygenase [Dendrothele bispora CBS 962.96]|uniref:Aromatic compound dioxygenase n=1 Tax=Dendrothele bispora (strain CBS 962.96) TaxID=1314807 RepID=A0A4S8MX45_DENBC|nr:aromatic compound dioxygenase [Dendrothele bispora CBS 962.96]
MVFLPTIFSATVTAASLAQLTNAHPHHAPGSPEALKRAVFQQNARRSLSNCHSELSKRGGVHEKAKVRREQMAQNLRKARGLNSAAPYKRDFSTVSATDHHSNKTGITNNTDASTLFDGQSSCVLGPETTQGPYYVDGEYVRWDIRDEQEGVDIYVDVQLIDVNTCEPVSDVYVDFWHANATGVYAGVVSSGNGNSNDESNLDTTFCRGIQKTNSDGVAQWLSVFPGHYTGRATHIHVMAHQTNGTVYSNGTYTGDSISHVGQLFFDQSLISTVEAVSPYSTNTQTLTTNEEDDIMSDEAGTIDPVLSYVLLGDDVSDGLMLWSSVGIDTNAVYSTSAAATLTEEGGVANENSMGGGPGGAGGPPGSSSSSGSGSASSGSSTAEAASSTESNAAWSLSMSSASTLVSFLFGLAWL